MVRFKIVEGSDLDFAQALEKATAENWKPVNFYQPYKSEESDRLHYSVLMTQEHDPLMTWEYSDETEIKTPDYLTLPNSAWIEQIGTSQGGHTVILVISGVSWRASASDAPTTPEESDALEFIRDGWTLASEEPTVPEDVLEALEFVRGNSTCNMLQRDEVLEALRYTNDHLTALWLENNPDRYMEALNEMGKRVNKKHGDS